MGSLQESDCHAEPKMYFQELWQWRSLFIKTSQVVSIYGGDEIHIYLVISSNFPSDSFPFSKSGLIFRFFVWLQLYYDLLIVSNILWQTKNLPHMFFSEDNPIATLIPLYPLMGLRQMQGMHARGLCQIQGHWLITYLYTMCSSVRNLLPCDQYTTEQNKWITIPSSE